MPDIKTAFSQAFYKAPDIQKVIAEWGDTEAQPVTTAPTTTTQEKQMPYEPQADTNEMTLSEVVFNHIRDNPMRGRAQIIEALNKQGYKTSSINTLLSQGVLCGIMLRDDQGRHTVLGTRFKPITQRMVIKARRIKQKNNAGIAALKPQAKAEPQFKTVATVTSNTSIASLSTSPSTTDIDALLNSLTFNQAIGLYKKLKTMLGEV